MKKLTGRIAAYEVYNDLFYHIQFVMDADSAW